MMNILLFIHVVIAVLLIIVILLQRSGSDGISSMGGGGNNTGVVSGRTAANFFTKTTIALATLFLINALILANLSSRRNPEIAKKIDQLGETLNEDAAPIAK